MNIVEFSLARFTPSDIAAFNAIANPRLERRLWDSVTRQTAPSVDRLVVKFPYLDGPVFHCERDRTGAYTLWFRDRQGWHSIGTGQSADECLSIWTAKAKSA